MPLDNAGFFKPTVDDLDLIAISEERAEEWREYIRADFAANNGARSELVRHNLAKWRTEDRPFEVQRYIRGAPKDIARLAKKVHKAHPTATFSVQWFDVDPILYAHKSGQDYCLAIWHRGVVRAIADEVDLCLTQRFLRRYVNVKMV